MTNLKKLASLMALGACNLKKLASLMALGACFAATQGYAAGGGGSHMEPADIDLDNVASLQRGARNFMNYCSGCHSAIQHDWKDA
jgi:ubiquinol-cytochrome c reductase cytochrome c1 subunit